MERSYLGSLYKFVSIWLIGCAIVLRLFLPGLTVEMGENALVWLFAWAAFLFVVVDAMFSSEWSCKQPGLTVAIVLWLLLAFFSTLWAGDKVQALYQNMIWLSDILLFFCLCYWAKEKEILKYFIALLLSCFSIEIFYSLYQYFIGLPAMRLYVYAHPDVIKEIDMPNNMQFFQAKLQIPHIFGHFTLTNSLGGYCIFYLPLLGLLLWKEKKGKIFLGFLFISSCMALVMTASRGSILCLFIAIALWAGVVCLRRFSSKKLLLLSLFFLSGSICFYLLQEHTTCFDFIGKNSLSFVMRLAYWESALQILANHIFLGVGVGNFKYHYYTYKYPWAEEVNKVHNGYLEWGVETGILGILVLGFLLWRIFSFLKQRKDKEENLEAKEEEKKTRLFFLFLYAAVFCLIFLGILGRSFEFDSFQYWLARQTENTVLDSRGVEYCFPYILGIVTFVLWIFLYRFFYRLSYSSLSLALKIGILAFGLHNFIDIDFYEPTLSQNFWIFLGILICINQNKEYKYSIPFLYRMVSFLLILIFLCQLSFYLLPSLLNLGYMKRSLLYLENSLKTEKKEKEREKIAQQYSEELEKAISLAPWDDKLQIMQAIKNFQNANAFVRSHQRKDVSIDNLKKFLQDSLKELQKVTRYRPESVAYYFALVALFQEEARIWKHLRLFHEQKMAETRASENMEKLLKIYPQKILFLKIAGEIAEDKGEKQKALEYYKKSLYISDLDPNDTNLKERQELIQKILFLQSP